jgi:hypothetical protein
MTKTAKLSEANLRQFTGSENWYQHGINRNVLFTDGAKYIADEGGANWLLDAIAICQRYERRVSDEAFQVWKLKVNADRTAALTATTAMATSFTHRRSRSPISRSMKSSSISQITPFSCRRSIDGPRPRRKNDAGFFAIAFLHFSAALRRLSRHPYADLKTNLYFSPLRTRRSPNYSKLASQSPSKGTSVRQGFQPRVLDATRSSCPGGLCRSENTGPSPARSTSTDKCFASIVFALPPFCELITITCMIFVTRVVVALWGPN